MYRGFAYLTGTRSPGFRAGAGCSRLVHWDDPEGWDGKGGGKGVQDGEHMYTVADSCQCMAKATTILYSN